MNLIDILEKWRLPHAQLLLIELFNNLENTVAHTLRPDKVLDDLLVCTVQYIKGENRKCLADWLKVNRTKT